MQTSTADRVEWLLSKTRKEGTCLVWVLSKSRLGYGQVGRGVGKPTDGRYGSGFAHRQLWELLNGPVRAGYELDHLCRNPSCINPTHLEVVTHGENLRRGLRGVVLRGPNCRHCGQAYATSLENGKLRRRCRNCFNQYRRTWRERQRTLARQRPQASAT